MLAPGALACRSCGVAVSEPTTVEHLTPAYGDYGGIGVRPIQLPMQERVTRCVDCTTRRARASALADAHRLGPVYGPEVAVDLLDAALGALDVLGIRGDLPPSLTRSRSSVRAMIDSLAHVGSECTWAASFVPILMASAVPDGCAVRRWSHLKSDLIRTVLAAYASLIERLTEPTYPTRPPKDADVLGCAACGVGEIPARPSGAAIAWGMPLMIDPSTVGGRPTPTERRAYLCPTCRAAVAGPFGSYDPTVLGMAAVERALLSFLGLTVAPGWSLVPSDIHAFAALKPGTPGSGVPWAHLNIDKLAARLRRSMGVHPVEDAR